MTTQARPFNTVLDTMTQDWLTRAQDDDGLSLSAVRSILGAVAAEIHAIELQIIQEQRNRIPTLADEEHLTRWASMWGLVRDQGQAATGRARLMYSDAYKANNDTANISALPSEKLLLVSSEGAFILTDFISTDETELIANIECTTAGSKSLSIDTELLVQLDPDKDGTNAEDLSIFSSTASISQATEGGRRAQTIEEFRAQVINAMRTRARVGRLVDFEYWAVQTGLCTQAYATIDYNNVDGAIGISVVDSETEAQLSAESLASIRQSVRAQIPTAHSVTVLNVSYIALDISLSITPNTQANRDLASTLLTAAVRGNAKPGNVFQRNWLDNGLAGSGFDSWNISNPSGDLSPNANELYKIGTITFV